VQFINQAVEAHVRNELRLIADITIEEREMLSSIFRHWLQSFESPIDREPTPEQHTAG
jgi:hypothetical protein